MTLDYMKPNKLTDDEIKERLLAAAVQGILQPHVPQARPDDFEDLPSWTRVQPDDYTVYKNCRIYHVALRLAEPVCTACRDKLVRIYLCGYREDKVGIYFNLGLVRDKGNCFLCGVDWEHERKRIYF